jgi:hypothetical protein
MRPAIKRIGDKIKGAGMRFEVIETYKVTDSKGRVVLNDASPATLVQWWMKKADN